MTTAKRDPTDKQQIKSSKKWLQFLYILLNSKKAKNVLEVLTMNSIFENIENEVIKYEEEQQDTINQLKAMEVEVQRLKNEANKTQSTIDLESQHKKFEELQKKFNENWNKIAKEILLDEKEVKFVRELLLEVLISWYNNINWEQSFISWRKDISLYKELSILFNIHGIEQ